MKLGLLALFGVGACSFHGSGDQSDAGAAAGATDGRVDAPLLPYPDEVMADSPIGYWRMDETSGNTIHDELGAHDGTLMGTCNHGRAGALSTGAALHFGDKCYADLGASFDFSSTAPYTIEAWVTPDVVDGNFRHVFTHETRDGNGPVDGYALLLRDTNTAFTERASNHANTATPDGTTGGEVNGFTYLVATFDGQMLTVFENSATMQSRDASDAVKSTTVHAFIGSASTNGNFLLGTLDEVALYDHVLPSSRIAAHFAAAK